MSPPTAVVVVPARDEEERIGACLGALAAQVDAPPFVLVLVLDGCLDETEAEAVRVAEEEGLTLELVPGPERGVGFARRAGFAAAAALLQGAPAGAFIASTDADTVVSTDWLASIARAFAGGADAVGGRIELDPAEAGALPAAVLQARAAEAERRLSAVRRHTPSAGHHQFSGASLALTLDAHQAVGGIPAVGALEDEALERALLSAGCTVVYDPAVGVRTSARTEGRVPRGLAQVLRTSRWRARTDAAAPRSTRPGIGADVLVVRPGADTPGADLHAALASGSEPLVLTLAPGVDAQDAAVLLDVLRDDPQLVLARAAEPRPDPLAELVIRPALNLYAPELAQLTSPLTRTWAARGAFLRACSLPAGDAVGLTVLLDAWAALGLDAVTERPVPTPPGEGPGDAPLLAYELLGAFADRLPAPPARSSAFTDPSGTRRARLEQLPPVVPT